MIHRVRHRPVEWEDGWILRLAKDGGGVRVITSYTDDSNYCYHPMSLPGNPKTGDKVAVAWGYFGDSKQCRCRVAGREYVAIADGPVWQALDTGEIVSMWLSLADGGREKE